jgi:hypothetical protein
MAVRYAVATGNWSDTATWDGGTLPTNLDDVLTNGFIVTIDQDVQVLSLRNTALSPAVQGGSFIVSGDFAINTVTLMKNSDLISYNGNGNMSISTSALSVAGGGRYLVINGNGNVNWVGSLLNINVASVNQIFKAGSGKLNFTGDIDVLSMTNAAAVQINAGDFEMTGDITIRNSSNAGGQNECVRMSSTGQCVVVGSLYNISTVANQTRPNCIASNVACYIKHIGTMHNQNSNNGGYCVESINVLAINIFTGPFICNNYGMLPFSVPRLFYQETIGSYFEFRDSSTDGAPPPATPAPATRLVSPDTVVDAPIPANVRDGISYAFATLTGTLKVPPPNSVAAGVPTDNTVGNAVLTPDAVWDYATANLTDPNSIGARLKNASTVDTTGEQLEALL